MTKAPKMTAAMRSERLAATASKRDIDMTSSREIEVASVAAPGPVRETPRTLPKVTLYAHSNVLKAVRLLAVEDGVQAQEILRAAVRDYLAKRGHTFSDLTTGE